MLTEGYSPLAFLIFAAALSMLPFIAVVATSFIKISVVLLLLRNAMGLQQIPPTMMVNALAIILSIFIMAPVGFSLAEIVENRPEDMTNVTSPEMKAFLKEASQPFRDFMMKHSSGAEREFFLTASKRLWPAEHQDKISSDSLLILIPAFTMSELRNAFEIGFLLFLPFIIIDLVVANILMALGMIMVSPMVISVPFKLLLFILADGWTRLLHGLVLSYQ